MQFCEFFVMATSKKPSHKIVSETHEKWLQKYLVSESWGAPFFRYIRFSLLGFELTSTLTVKQQSPPTIPQFMIYLLEVFTVKSHRMRLPTIRHFENAKLVSFFEFTSFQIMHSTSRT